MIIHRFIVRHAGAPVLFTGPVRSIDPVPFTGSVFRTGPVLFTGLCRLSLLILLLASGCAPLVKTEQAAQTGYFPLHAGLSQGQTFVARYGGLQGIDLYLRPEGGSPVSVEGQVLLHLKAKIDDTEDLRTAQIPLSEIREPGYYRFSFKPIQSSNQHYYQAIVEIQGSGRLEAGYAAGNSYLNGAAYQNEAPLDAQLAFRLAYEPILAARALAREGLNWLIWLAIAAWLFILPGWGVLSLLWPGWGALHWAEKLGLGGGLSLALYPVLVLWTNLVGLYLGAIYAWLPPLIGLFALLYKNRPPVLRCSLPALSGEPSVGSASPSPRTVTKFLPDMAFLFIVTLTILTRFWAMRGLEAPMWGDSMQHTMITQLILEHGGLFRSWLPYSELTTFTYHFGFHTLAAAFAWITHLPSAQATLITGQLVNIAAVIFLYPLALRLTKSPWGGILAVLVAALLAPQPMVYINWGRYTQLAGQAILPAAITLAWVFLEGSSQQLTPQGTQRRDERYGALYRPRLRSAWYRLRSSVKHTDLRLLIPGWLMLGGLALTHFRVLVFAATFFVIYFVLEVGLRDQRLQLQYESTVKNSKWRMQTVFWRTAGLGIGAWLIFMPWFMNLFGGKTPLIFSNQITTPVSQLSDFTQQYNSIGNLFLYLPPLLWVLMPLLAGYALWQRNRGIALVSCWWFFTFLIANPQWFQLPGAGAISTFAVMIAIYIPAGLLIGGGAAMLVERSLIVETLHATSLLYHHSTTVKTILLACLFAISLWGARLRLYDVDIPGHAMLTRPDTQAMQWIMDNTPPTSRFLVNSFFAYNNYVVAGSDAGWWLTLLTHRQTTLPPMNYGSEQGPSPDYRQWINRLPSLVLNNGLDDPAVLDEMKKRQITHVFIGQQQGSVNYLGPKLEPSLLLKSFNYRLVYHQDRVWIFETMQAVENK